MAKFNILAAAKSIINAPNDYVQTILDKIYASGAASAQASTAEPAAQPEKAPKLPTIRGVPIDKAAFDEEVRPIIFGEVSNRDSSKKELEARVILNTGINRAKAYADKGVKDMDLRGVFTQENQYQAYGGNQYKLYKSGGGDGINLTKKKEVDSIMDKLWGEIESGNFEDDTNNAFYYIHNPDETITYDDTRPLFK